MAARLLFDRVPRLAPSMDRFRRFNQVGALGIAWRYGGPLLAVALAASGTTALHAITHRNNWALLYAAIGASAWFAGIGGGVWATALSTLVALIVANHLLSAPTFQPADLSRIVTFGATGLFVSWLTAGRQTALQTLQGRARKQEAVATLSQQALSTTDVALLLQEAAVAVAETLHVDVTSIVELMPDGQQFLIRAAVGWQDGVVGRLRVGTKGLSGHSLRTRAPVIVDDLAADRRFVPPPELQAHKIKSSISVPIYREGRAHGALNAHSRSRRQFNADDVHYMQSIANVLAMALDRDRTERALIDNVAELERRTDEMKQLSELGELLQSCRTLDEAGPVIERSAAALFSETSGGVYLLRSSQNLLEAVASWGGRAGEPLFPPDDCWALRRGRPYRLAHGAEGIPCRHLPHRESTASLCVPMMARGEALGLLHVCFPEHAPVTESAEQLVNMVAESVSLAVANLRLHESLQRQSIRDPLTGLFNRRYMEESFEREIRRANRTDQPVTVVMFDLDHFKLFNDTHGHGAGDRVLQELGHVLKRTCRGEDIACRYGGEEFTVILPGVSLAQARAYAESVREQIANLRIEYRREWLGPVTITAGVAVYPTHGRTAEAALAAADAALYDAKRAGRNAVHVPQVDLV